MASTAISGSPGIWRRGEHEVSLARLYVIRATCVLGAIGLTVDILPGLIRPDPVGRGMIIGMLGGLCVMALIGIRHPLKLVPILLFEFIWKTIWLLRFGLPQWLAGTGSPRLGEDLVGIGLGPFVFGLVIPWGYVWRHYGKAPGDRWR